MRAVEMKDPEHILAIHAAQLGTEREFVFEALSARMYEIRIYDRSAGGAT